ncbi:MAG: serine acetyltransferase [Phycisphaerae bacterium]|nr:serine acetyltransferase [Phycisphaerae bacterium]
MSSLLYRKTLRPLLHHIKKFKNFIRDLAVCIWRGWNLRLITACDINLYKTPNTTIFTHPVGIIISSKAVLGQHCSIRQNVTIGLKDEGVKEYPTLGDHVRVGAGAMILGGVKIGDRAVIGAGALVLKDVPADTIYYCRMEPVLKPTKENS